MQNVPLNRKSVLLFRNPHSGLRENGVPFGRNMQDSIHRKNLTDEVDAFIQSLSGKELCSYIVSRETGFTDILFEYMKKSDENTLHIMETVNSSYQDYCKNFESYDPIADFAYGVVGGYSYVVSDIACNILRYIAKFINRFHAQDLVQNLLDDGLEPNLEKILKS